ncbi:TldD/PmbA family protein [Dactylosporangium aurantiacum]|uniref:TldD/PmbA family protein n=1 Tax=Dactylosporangium aurantiacum TaxID=35754 RepID=A0A9Q9IG50_9ACTN|nr:metallopeptidase TldD-related protein [Dactylosporangium aurantiacum]MDG6104901.1 metallopeptidase TldD-related protein [Dactylosporangium aurantiacum]UWZ55559.1 TldD/PmbA family protein [Dactylosporangium aurantiacum]
MSETDLAARVLQLVDAGVEAEVVVERAALSLTRFANSYIHQNVADETTTVRLRLHADGRTATASSTVLDGIEDFVRRTVASMRLAPLDPTWPGLTPPAAGGAADAPGGTGGAGSGIAGNVDEATAAAAPDERAARVRAFVEQAGGLEVAGYCRTSATRVAYLNSAGQHLFGGRTSAAMDGIARTATSDGLARLASPRLADIDGAVLGARAAAKARAGADPVELAPGRYEVVLEPTAVADVLQMLAIYGFNAKMLQDRQSFLELGAAQFDPAVTIVEDATAPDSTALPFDVEGTPRRRVVLVDRGMSSAVVHDRRTAAKGQAASTGHAIPGGASFGAVPASLRLLAHDGPAPVEVDGPAADSGVAALVGGVERGLLVTDNHYTRVLDPRTLVVTGLTRNGVWLIEDGRVTRPVRNFRFTQSYPQALAPGAVLGVGPRAVELPGPWSESGTVAPALRLASWNYTGGASG